MVSQFQNNSSRFCISRPVKTRVHAMVNTNSVPARVAAEQIPYTKTLKWNIPEYAKDPPIRFFFHRAWPRPGELCPGRVFSAPARPCPPFPASTRPRPPSPGPNPPRLRELRLGELYSAMLRRGLTRFRGHVDFTRFGLQNLIYTVGGHGFRGFCKNIYSLDQFTGSTLRMFLDRNCKSR
jgi:hypothetical protein